MVGFGSMTEAHVSTVYRDCFATPACLVRPWHAEDVLADIGEDQIGRDRRGLVEAGLAPFALDVVSLGERETKLDPLALPDRVCRGVDFRASRYSVIAARPLASILLWSEHTFLPHSGGSAEAVTVRYASQAAAASNRAVPLPRSGGGSG